MNPHPNFTPIYLLGNEIAAHAISVFTGVENSKEFKQPKIRKSELTNRLMNQYGHGEILRTYNPLSSLHLRFIDHHSTWFGFDIIPFIRPENKDKVYKLITLLNEDDNMSFDYARFKAGLFGATELATQPEPTYEKLTQTKEKIAEDEAAANQNSLLTNNPPSFDDLIIEE